VRQLRTQYGRKSLEAGLQRNVTTQLSYIQKVFHIDSIHKSYLFVTAKMLSRKPKLFKTLKVPKGPSQKAQPILVDDPPATSTRKFEPPDQPVTILPSS